MSTYVVWGAIEIGLIYAIVAIGVFLTFNVLKFPDLTVDASFPIGAAVVSSTILLGINPWFATLLAVFASSFAGLITGLLTIRLGIVNILASILTMIAAYSINIRIMGKPNIALFTEDTIFSALEHLDMDVIYLRPLLVTILTLVIAIFVIRLLTSDFGLALRATGINPKLVRSLGSNPKAHTYFLLMLSNGLVGLGGAVFAQANGFADVNSGIGTIVVGLAAVYIGKAMIKTRSLWVVILAIIAGSIIYRFIIAIALNSSSLGLQASDLNFITAIMVVIALMFPKIKLKCQLKYD